MTTVHSNFNNAGIHRETQVVQDPPPAQSGGGSQVRRCMRICGNTMDVYLRGRFRTPASVISVTQERQSMINAESSGMSPLPPLPIDGHGHPLLRTLLQYASAYASGVAISGGLLSRREEAHAVLISLFTYIVTWQSLHSTHELEHEEYLQDMRRIIGACVSLEVRLRMEGASDQVVLAEAIEEWASCCQRQCRPNLADSQLRYDRTSTPYLPDPSAPAQTHAEFLIARRNACIPAVRYALEYNRNSYANRAQALRAPGDAMALYNDFVDIRAGEQIISYIYGTYCTIDDIGPSSFEQFMELSNDEKIRLIQRMVSTIEQSPPHELNATIRSLVEGIDSYIAITHPSREYRKQVADGLLIYLIAGMRNLWCCETSERTEAAIERCVKGLRHILRTVPPLRRLLNALREQFRRDGLFEHMGFVDSIRDKLQSDVLMAQRRLEQYPNNTQSTPDEPALSNFPISTRQNTKIFQDVSAEDLASLRNELLTEQNSIIETLHTVQEAGHKRFLKGAFFALHSYEQFLRFLRTIRPFPRITPPVATTTATSSSSSSTTTAQVSPPSSPSPEPTTTTSTTTTTTTLPAVTPTPTPVPPLPEPAAESLATTTTTTTIVRSMPRQQRPALNEQPPREPRKTSSTEHWRTITADQIRMLSRRNLLRFIREMDLDIDTGGGCGSHRTIRDKDGKRVAVLPDHRSHDTLGRKVAQNIYNAGHKEKGSS